MILVRSKNFSPLQKQQGMNGTLLSFLLGAIGALAIFLPFLIVDKGFFTYCGDFNSQQIPFYYYVQQFIKDGRLFSGGWSWATDLGSSAVNAYAFYNMGSPFLWLTVLFPSRWLPYMMVPLFALKFGCIAAAANLWLARYAKTRNMAVICSLAFAFCGFNVYNTFFNHMLDPVVIFPLMLWAMDGFFYDGKRGWFALFVGLSLLDSYFFFLGNVVFALLYFIVKTACREYRITAKTFGLLAFEAVLGVGLGMVLALPSFYNLIGNPRTDNFANGFSLLMYGRVQQYFSILSSLFLPPDPPYLPNIYTDAVVKWTSMSAFIPIIGISGALAYCRSRKGGSVKLLLGIGLLMALVPILNSSFYAFNASYYARWYYMPLLIVALASLRSLEDADIDLEWGAKLALILTAVHVVFGIIPAKKDDIWTLGVVEISAKFWLTLLTALLSAGLFYVLVRTMRGRARFASALLAAVMGFSVFYSVIHISLGKFEQWERDAAFREQQYIGANELDLPTDGFYRIDAYECYDNVGLWADQSCLQTFNSTVTPSIMAFYPLVGVTRDVSSKPELSNYALRGLLSCRYTVMPVEKLETFLTEEGVQGWTFLKDTGALAVYENDNFVPLGFTYDQYMTMDAVEGARTEDRSALMMRAIGLDSAQTLRFAHLFPDGEAVYWEATTPAPVTDASGAAVPDESVPNAPGGWYRYDTVNYDSYVADCDARRATAAYLDRHDASGFTVRIEMPRENLVFFSVPYDEGFTATVNGEAAEVLKVSGGMMAVLAPAGDNEIVFTYHTPGLFMGGVITLLALAVLALYLLLVWRVRKKMAAKRAGSAQGVENDLAQDSTGPAMQQVSPDDILLDAVAGTAITQDTVATEVATADTGATQEKEEEETIPDGHHQGTGN